MGNGLSVQAGGVGFVVEFLGAIVGAVYFMVVGVIGAIKGAPVPVLSYIGLAFVLSLSACISSPILIA